jgi:ElaB/YqjD/DUF883 family membrane-anchored ribosome-binding protein
MNTDAYTDRDSAAEGAVAIGEGMKRTLDAGAAKAQAAMHTIATTAKDVSSKAAEVRDTVSKFIEERPLTAVIIALGVGALVARSFSRR